MYIMCVIHVLCLFVALSGGVGALHVSALYFYTALNEDLNKFCIHSDIQIDMRLLTVVIKRLLYNFTVLLNLEDVPQVEFMFLVFTGMPGESYRRQLRSLLLYSRYVFRALINFLCVDNFTVFCCWLH